MNVAVLGYGTVGVGVVEILRQSAGEIARKAGQPLTVSKILVRHDYPGSPDTHLFVRDFEEILRDETIGLVAEAMGGLHPAYDYCKASLEAGKSVVTANKELIAEKGAELLEIAARHGVNLLFEASVAGGIPVLHALTNSLWANEITAIAGILNGTTNFILTKMFREGMSFADALAIAQAKGYAESDPTADVEGIDACRKICILAGLAFGCQILPAQVPTKGISSVTAADVAYAAGWGGAIKLLGQCRRSPDGKVWISVEPSFVPGESQLAGANDVFNSVVIRGSWVGEVALYGPGAGRFPTASAVVSDLMEASRARGTLPMYHWEDRGEMTADPMTQPMACYLRMEGAGAQAAATMLFGVVEILEREGAGAEEFACLTPQMTLGEILLRVKELEKQGVRVLARMPVSQL